MSLTTTGGASMPVKRSEPDRLERPLAPRVLVVAEPVGFVPRASARSSAMHWPLR